MPIRQMDDLAEIARERDLAAVETSNESFDRIAFAEHALRLVKPRHTTVALCQGPSRARVKIEAGRDWGHPRSDAKAQRWAILSVPPTASKRAIAVAVAGLAEPVHAPYVLDVLLSELAERLP